MRPGIDAVRPLGWSEPGRTSRELTTGGWRTQRPVWVEAQAPCRAACPAVEPIARWIERARAGDWSGAWSLIREENPFPAVMGRVCAHPCETGCNRGAWDGAVAINALERFVGDWGLVHGRVTPPAARRPEQVAVIGAGPAGLSCAYHLQRLGYRVTVFEAEAELGGVLRYGIPPYRLPRAVLDREIDLVLALGIDVVTGQRLAADTWDDVHAWDAVFLATGASVPIPLAVAGANASGVIDGLDLLRRVSLGKRPTLGQRVAVLGGGSTAMDVARTARRLGVPFVTVLALEARDAMPAIPDEITQAVAEDVEIVNGVGVRAFRERAGAVTGVEIGRAHLGRDASGTIVPVFEPGADTVIDADTVLLAIGQGVDAAMIPARVLGAGGIVSVEADGATPRPRVFAGGDVASRQRTVAHAIGSGTRAARAIHAMLSGITTGPFAAAPSWSTGRTDVVVPPTRIGTHVFPRALRAEPWERLPSARVGSFVEVVEGLGEGAARGESERCFTCGHCVACDVCLRVCPDMAIARVAGYALDGQHCKGCGLCARECPRGALLMELER